MHELWIQRKRNKERIEAGTHITVPGPDGEKKQRGEKIVAVTAYDFAAARIADKAGRGHRFGRRYARHHGARLFEYRAGHAGRNPSPCQSGAARPEICAAAGDMPFGTYQAGQDDAIRNAARLLKEGEAQAVKLEGGAAILATVQRMTDAGIPVCGHLGLTPQSIHAFGGNKAQGKTDEAAQKLLRDAQGLQEAGAFALVLEAIPARSPRRSRRRLRYPPLESGRGRTATGRCRSGTT